MNSKPDEYIAEQLARMASDKLDNVGRHIEMSLVCLRANCMTTGKDIPSFIPHEWLNEHRVKMDVKAAERQGRPGNCISNSYDYIVELQMQGIKAHYIEGYVTVHGVPLAHAWVEIDGKYVDPTLRDIDSNNEFWGVRIPMELFFMCVADESWPFMTGCFEVMARFDDKELAIAKKLLEGANAV